MAKDTYDVGSGIEVPGLEAVFEYGDSSGVVNRIPGAFRINDRSSLEQAHCSQIVGLADDPDGRSSSQPNTGQHGETPGSMLYGGRTVGLTGEVKAGSLSAVRDTWRRFRRSFGVGSSDLLVHPAGEVQAFANECLDTALARVDWWGFSAVTGTTPGPSSTTNGSLPVLELTVTGASSTPGDIVLVQTGGMAEWSGEDVFIGVLVAQTGGPAVLADVALSLYVKVPLGGGAFSTFKTGASVQSLSSVSQGVFRWVSGRIAASSILPGTVSVGLAVTATTNSTPGDYAIQIARPMVVLLRADQAAPAGYVGAELPGFEPDGVAPSSSHGPCSAVNQVGDPNFTCLKKADATLVQAGASGDFPTIVGPLPQQSGVGSSLSIRSCYLMATKDSNTTSRTVSLTLQNSGLNSDSRFVVAEGRSYRTSMVVNLLQQPTSDAVVVLLRWHSHSGSTVSGADVTHALSHGINYVDLKSTAPAGAVQASLQVRCTTTQFRAVVELRLSDPCFVDVSEHDCGHYIGAGEPTEEVDLQEELVIDGTTQTVNTGVRRRIPRPFLLQQVRKTSDAKAPEQQVDGKYQRPFTMSVRASDPRIYVLDCLRSQFKLSGSGTVSRVGSTDFTLETALLPVPAGWTYEGYFIASPGGSPYVWSKDSFNYTRAGAGAQYHPFDAIGLKTWDSAGAHSGNRPTSNIDARMYRSVEGITYTEPRVVMGGAPSGFGDLSGIGTYADVGRFNYQVGGSPTAPDYAYTGLTLLLKLVDATHWIELRWNSVSHDGGADFGFASTNAPHAFELWCSHNASGTLATTLLSSWDYESYDSRSGYYPFLPSIDSMWLTSWLDAGNVVHWELFKNSYPGSGGVGRIESGSYSLSSSLASILGTSVAGQAGMSMRIGRAFDDATFANIADRPPFVRAFEMSDASELPTTKSCSVIGDIDTPQVIQLRGDVTDPVISITVPEMDGEPAQTSVTKLLGTISDANPVTIDSDRGTIKDARGNNVYSMLVPGGKIARFRPGLNVVTLQARAWLDYDAHMVVSSRDALK